MGAYLLLTFMSGAVGLRIRCAGAQMLNGVQHHRLVSGAKMEERERANLTLSTAKRCEIVECVMCEIVECVSFSGSLQI